MLSTSRSLFASKAGCLSRMVGLVILRLAIARVPVPWVTTGARIDLAPVPPVDAVLFGWWDLLYEPLAQPLVLSAETTLDAGFIG